MASTLLSPGVAIQERDLTLGSIETVEVNVGAFAGPFARGPVLEPVRVTSNPNCSKSLVNPQIKTLHTGGLLPASFSTVVYWMLFAQRPQVNFQRPTITSLHLTP